MPALAETANTRRDIVSGNIRIVKMQPTAAINNNDTWLPGLRIVEHVDLSANASGTTWGYTVSGGTITFLVSAATTATDVIAWGY